MTFISSVFSAGLSMLIFGFVLNKYEKEESDVPASVSIFIISLVVVAFCVFMNLITQGVVLCTIK